MARFVTTVLLLIICVLFTHLYSAPNKPNIIFLLIDDLGWANVGYHAMNNETKTPNIDRLATTEGLQLNLKGF